MRVRFRRLFKALSLSERFMLVSLLVIVAGTLAVGRWVAGQIETGVIHQSAATTALYVDSFIRPYVEELRDTATLSPQSQDALGRLLQETALGRQIVAFKLWDTTGRVLYSTDASTIGQTFPMHELLRRAVDGQIAAHISDLQEVENAPQGREHARLIEIYSPVRLSSMDRIVAIAEFYQDAGGLEATLRASQRQSWLVVSTVMSAIYLLLAFYVRRTSKATEELHERVRRAAADATSSNERFLRRTSAELHDGPIQDLGFALLRLDRVMEAVEAQGQVTPASAAPLAAEAGAPAAVRPTVGKAGNSTEDLASIRASLQRALGEVRAISRGMSLPELASLNVEETVRRAVRDHERRTATTVRMQLAALPEAAPGAVKMALYRLLQEALTNAARHAGGRDQAVRVQQEGDSLRLEVVDDGPGFDPAHMDQLNGRLGLAGMRDRAESLGGRFEVISAPGKGTRVIALLPLGTMEGRGGR